MKTYIGYLNQGGGCDYTIGCGETIINIKADSIDEAVNKLYEKIKESYSHEDRRLEYAQLFEVNSIVDLNLTEIYEKIDLQEKQRIAFEREQREMLEFERLKSKYGK